MFCFPICNCVPIKCQIHYIDVIMTTMASQITSLTVVYSNVCSDADQRKHQSSASLVFVRGIHRDRWIPRTKGQLRGKCFHLITSSCISCHYSVYPQRWLRGWRAYLSTKNALIVGFSHWLYLGGLYYVLVVIRRLNVYSLPMNKQGIHCIKRT